MKRLIHPYQSFLLFKSISLKGRLIIIDNTRIFPVLRCDNERGWIHYETAFNEKWKPQYYIKCQQFYMKFGNDYSFKPIKTLKQTIINATIK